MAEKESVKPEVKEEKPYEQARQESRESLQKAREILKQYGGQEANIPISSEYWSLMNAHRASEQSFGQPSPYLNPSVRARVTEPYVQLPDEVIRRIPRPPQVETDAREARAHYDRQHPAAQSVLQHEIQKQTAAMRTPEEQKEVDDLQKAAEERDADTAKRQDEVNQRAAEEQKRRDDARMEELKKQQEWSRTQGQQMDKAVQEHKPVPPESIKPYPPAEPQGRTT